MADRTQTVPRWSAAIGARPIIDIDEQARKELMAGNTTPGLLLPGNRAYTASEYYQVLNRMRERSPALAAYGKAVAERGEELEELKRDREQLKDRIEDLKQLKRSVFYGDIDWITRWLIDNETTELASRLAAMTTPEPVPKPVLEPVDIWPKFGGTEPRYSQLLSEVGGRYYWAPIEEAAIRSLGRREEPIEIKALPEEGPAPYKAPTRLPIPSWMEEFLEPTVVGPAERAKGAYALRPFGAQLKLGPEKLEKLAGYLGWTRAGAPLSLGLSRGEESYQQAEDYLRALEQLPAWWEEQAKLSEKLFPKAKRMPELTWQATYQR